MASTIMKKTVFIISFIVANIILVKLSQSQNAGTNNNNELEKIIELIKIAESHLYNKPDSSLVLGEQAYAIAELGRPLINHSRQLFIRYRQIGDKGQGM